MNTKVRESNFELMKIISMFIIVVWHFITRGHIVENCSERVLLVIKLIQYIIIVHVNSFVLVTGYFQYKSTFKKGKVFSLIGQSLFYRILAVIIFLSFGLKSLTTLNILQNTFIIDIVDSYWFINCYIVLIIISPYLNKLIKNMNQKEHRKLILIMILLFSIIPNISYQLNVKNNGFSVVQFILLYFIGSYFSKYPLKNNRHFKNFSKYKTRVILIVIFCLSFIFNYLRYYFCSYLLTFDGDLIKETGMYLRQGCECYGDILVIIQSVSFFLFFETINLKNNMINKIASLTLGVYLIHENILVRSLLYNYLNFNKGIEITSYKILLIILLYSIVVFIVCLIIEGIRKYICYLISKSKLYCRVENNIKKIINEF